MNRAIAIIAMIVLGILVWNYQAGIIRFNPKAWLFRLEYLVSTENLARGTVGCLGALGGFLSADRLRAGDGTQRVEHSRLNARPLEQRCS